MVSHHLVKEGTLLPKVPSLSHPSVFSLQRTGEVLPVKLVSISSYFLSPFGHFCSTVVTHSTIIIIIVEGHGPQIHRIEFICIVDRLS